MSKEQILALFGDNPIVQNAAVAAIALTVAFIAYWIAKVVVLRIVHSIVSRTSTNWDNILEERGVFTGLAWIAPALVAYYAAYVFAAEAEGIIQRLLLAYIIGVLMMVSRRVLNAVSIIYNTTARAKEVPIKGYIQVANLIIFLIGIIVIFAQVLGQSPWGLLSGLGAMTAIILLVFRDTILSFVASIQIASNDMVRIGDWVSMPQYGTDGDVIDIALHVVKIQNWDKTITTVPTKAFIEESFKNWRGMTEAGGRRIKRAVALDAGSVRFLTDDDLNRLEKVSVLKPYLMMKQKELEEANESVNDESLINGRRLTNIGTFRAYVMAYLKQNENLSDKMTFLVRQLEPGPQGVPIEIYVFSSDIRWVYYEAIQGDIFDHLMAAVPEFGLRLFQHPTGYDFRAVGERMRVE